MLHLFKQMFLSLHVENILCGEMNQRTSFSLSVSPPQTESQLAAERASVGRTVPPQSDPTSTDQWSRAQPLTLKTAPGRRKMFQD